MQYAVDEAFSDIFRVGFEEANLGFKNTSYYFMEGAFMEMAVNDCLEDMIERHPER